MNLVVNGWALLAGAVLGAFGLLGLLFTKDTVTNNWYLAAGPLLPVLAWPLAACATALDAEVARDWRSQAKALWPAYVGLGVLSAVVGGWWIYFSTRGSHENYAGMFLVFIAMAHLAAFAGTGLLLFLIPKTRPAGIQVWFGYIAMCVCWLIGGMVAM